MDAPALHSTTQSRNVGLIDRNLALNDDVSGARRGAFVRGNAHRDHLRASCTGMLATDRALLGGVGRVEDARDRLRVVVDADGAWARPVPDELASVKSA